MINKSLLFQVKAGESPARFIDVVGTREAVEKLRCMRPVFLVAVEDHAILNGKDTESGLCSLRLEVIDVEVFSLDEKEEENHATEPVDQDAGLDPAFVRLRDAGLFQ